MTAHEDHQPTASLVEGILQSWRDRQREETAAHSASGAGADPGSDVEAQADALAAAAAGLGELLTAFASQPRRSLDAIAVFRALSRSAGSIAGAAAELSRQEWVDLDDAEQEARDSWNAALAGLRAAEGTFAWVADGWI